MLTDFVRELIELRLARRDNCAEFSKKIGIDELELFYIERGLKAVPNDIVGKVLKAYKPDRERYNSLRRAFRRAKAAEKWREGAETEVFFWYAEAFHWLPDGRPCLTYSEYFSPWHPSLMGALYDAQYNIKQDAVIYVFRAIRHNYSPYGAIDINSLALCTAELFIPPKKYTKIWYILGDGDLWAAKERFRKLLATSISDEKERVKEMEKRRKWIEYDPKKLAEYRHYILRRHERYTTLLCTRR